MHYECSSLTKNIVEKSTVIVDLVAALHNLIAIHLGSSTAPFVAPLESVDDLEEITIKEDA